MKRVLSTRLLALGIALGAIAGVAVFVAPALGGASKGAVVSLKKTTLNADTFVGDKRAGQTSGEGVTNFGAGWYVLTANGKKVEETTSSGSSDSGSSGSSGGYGW
jgi:hypothetical protein